MEDKSPGGDRPSDGQGQIPSDQDSMDTPITAESLSISSFSESRDDVQLSTRRTRTSEEKKNSGGEETKDEHALNEHDQTESSIPKDQALYIKAYTMSMESNQGCSSPDETDFSSSEEEDNSGSSSEDEDENEKGDSFDEEHNSKRPSGILFEVAPIQFNNFHTSPSSPRAASKMMHQVRKTLRGRDASELLMLATEAIEAIAISGNVEHNEKHICLEEFATKSPEDYEVLEEEVDKLALLDLAYAHLAHRVQDRLTPATLDHLTHRLEIHESMREHDFNEMQRHQSPERVLSRRPSVQQYRMGTLAAIWNHHLDSGLLVFYKVPIVRHRFEDAQHEHEVDWADLFFDLTYVGAAYQLGTLLKSDVSFWGFFHFMSFALCMMDAWKFKTMHDSTFEATDVVHKLTDVMYVSTIAGASIFIRPIYEMENLYTGHAFGLSFCLALNVFVLAAEKIEILFVSKDPDAVQQSKNILLIEIFPRVVCFLTATVIAGIGSTSDARQDDDDHHFDEVQTMSLRAISLCLLASHLLSTVVPLIGYLSKFLPVNPIPWHYEHIAHRYGEWVMLMLGESILSIILTPVHNRFRYYLAFGVALLTVQMMQLVHFSSEEFDPDKHALSRKLRAGRTWVQLMTFYSIALIAFGVGLKAMLYSVVCTGEDDDHRRLGADDTSSYSSYSAYNDYDDHEFHEYCDSVPGAYTRLLCCASVAQYVFLQISLMLHEGIKEYVKHVFNYSSTSAYMLYFCKVLTIIGTLELIIYSGNLRAHEIIIVIGTITLVQSLCQALENMMTHVRKLHVEKMDLSEKNLNKNKKAFYRQSSGDQNFIVSWIFGAHEDRRDLRGDNDSDDDDHTPPSPVLAAVSSRRGPMPFFKKSSWSSKKKPTKKAMQASVELSKSKQHSKKSTKGGHTTKKSLESDMEMEKTI